MHGFTLKWDHELSILKPPPPISAKLQDDTSAISATNCYPSKISYEIFPDVAILGQWGHLSPCPDVETCGSMASLLESRAKKHAVEAGAAGGSTAFSSLSMPPTNTLSAYFISLKVGGGSGADRDVVSVKRRAATINCMRNRI